MVIRALAAAAAVVFGMGQAVQAASVGYDLRYESSVFEDVFLYDEEIDESFFAEELDILDVPGYVSTLFPNAVKGDIFRLQAEIGEDEDGYKASDCSIGSFDCTTYSRERLVSLDPLTIVADAFGIWSDGSQVTLTSWGRWDGDGFDLSTGDRWGRAGAITTTFTIVELAPVPLPASAALLPLGLGALAMMRRRRKPV
ncbi:VPLPA-CTERM protein sorting domain-containing protein [Paracoccus sediminis]|uniref:VPLPA-CTERM protein sorting domain-containing protein n=2 Tax=Paracoccus sediminis TaxID=1214787 RepID=A0A238Y6M6_9RHOB|nr:VPLPA-CTERM protein sorting domain-containing protein [Paracoccus sediminis]